MLRIYTLYSKRRHTFTVNEFILKIYIFIKVEDCDDQRLWVYGPFLPVHRELVNLIRNDRAVALSESPH